MRDVRLDLSAPPPKQRSTSRFALFSVIALCGVIAILLGVAFGMSQASASKPRPPTAEGLTFWSGGDSMSYYISTAIREALLPQRAIPLQEEPEYRTGSGLNSPEFFDWPTYFETDVLPLDPDMIVFMVGANDSSSFTPEEYRGHVGAMMDAMKADGRYVVWIGQPNMQDPAFAEKMRAINDVFRSEAAKRSWVRYVDTWDVSSDGNGDYAPYLKTADGAEVLARNDDGIHLTPAGGAILAKVVLDEVFGE